MSIKKRNKGGCNEIPNFVFHTFELRHLINVQCMESGLTFNWSNFKTFALHYNQVVCLL